MLHTADPHVHTETAMPRYFDVKAVVMAGIEGRLMKLKPSPETKMKYVVP